MRSTLNLLLEKITKLVEDAVSLEDKIAIVQKKIKKDLIASLKKSHDNLNLDLELQRLLDSGEIFFSPEDSPLFEHTTAMALAVCLGDVAKVKLFLNYIPDINDSNYFVWGYRQLYSYVHLVGNPHMHISCLHFHEGELQELIQNRTQILEELAKKGADFNWLKGHRNSDYQNPPLSAANDMSGHYHGTNPQRHSVISSNLTKKYVLFGANPAIFGSSFGMGKDSVVELIRFAAQTFFENKLNNHGAYLRLDPKVFECFSGVLAKNEQAHKIKNLLLCYNKSMQDSLTGDLAKQVFKYAVDLKQVADDEEIKNKAEELVKSYRPDI